MTKSDSTTDSKTLTPAHEDYIKAIYTLQAQGVRVNNSALASHLDVTPASTTNMVKRLAELDLVVYEPYQNITLTEAGERVALEVLRHHRLLELYLHKKLNLPWDQVHHEAEKLEHVISEALEDAIAAALDHPTVDPHGDPIPTKDGQIGAVIGSPLTHVALNQPCRVVRVLLQDPAWLTYIGSLGLYPGAPIVVHKRAPFHGPLLIEVNNEQHALAHEMANLILAVEI